MTLKREKISKAYWEKNLNENFTVKGTDIVIQQEMSDPPTAGLLHQQLKVKRDFHNVVPSCKSPSPMENVFNNSNVHFLSSNIEKEVSQCKGHTGKLFLFLSQREL